jgi:hypothetical protein
LAATAMLAGNYSDEATEIHLPYNPKDEREKFAMAWLSAITW